MMNIDVDVFKDWHPQFDLASESTSGYIRRLSYSPKIIDNALTFIVSIRDRNRMVTKDFEFDDIQDAINQFNNFESVLISIKK